MSNERKAILRPGDKDGNAARWNDYLENVRELAGVVFANGQDLELIARAKTRNRSLAQNRLLWQWYKEIADHINDSQGTNFSDDDVHEWMREQFLGSQIVEIQATPVRSRKSTRKLTVAEMTEYLERIDHFAAQHLGCQLSHPDDLWHEAMGNGA